MTDSPDAIGILVISSLAHRLATQSYFSCIVIHFHLVVSNNGANRDVLHA